MKFGKLLNSGRDRDRNSSRVPDRKNGHLVRTTEEKVNIKSDLHDITNPRQAPKPPQEDLRAAPEPLQRKPDPIIPGYTSLAQRNHAQPPSQQVSPEAPWSSRFSDSTGRSVAPHENGLGPELEPLPPLQLSSEASGRARGLQPLRETDVDPDSFDLAAPAPAGVEVRPLLEPLERRSLLMFSKTHLRIVFADLKLLRRFSVFLMEHRPEHVPLLVYHLDVRKALAAIRYTNSVTSLLKPMEGLAFTREQAPETMNEGLMRKLEESFSVLANEDLPAWITSVWMRAVEVSIRRRINGSLPTQLRDMSEGLAETFCLSDPARHDNPILFASEEFNRMTQYSNKYVIGRNCRIFQGPQTNRHGVRRIREKLERGEQHYEPCLNYRRDGSPFMNLLMITPLLDGNGKVRYYLGAQIDTSGLLNDFYGFEHLQQYIDKPGYEVDGSEDEGPVMDNSASNGKNELQELSELFNHDELGVIQRHGGRLHYPDLQEPPAALKKKQRLVINADGSADYEDDPLFGSSNGVSSSTPWESEEAMPGELPPKSPNANNSDSYDNRIMHPGTDPSFLSTSGHSASAAFDAQHGGQLGGVYEHYLLVRPAPYLRILFASPSLRIPGMVQSSLMDRIGGSPQLRNQIEQAMTNGQSVTAKVKWIPNPKKVQNVARNRWIHATPLLGRDGEVGVWMVVLVDDERERMGRSSAGTSLRESVRTTHSKVPSVASRTSTLEEDGDSPLRRESNTRESAAIDGLRPPPPMMRGKKNSLTDWE
ncbi:hypothetical protein N0V93_008201 [Gnomoniopsis smithogilvyi]|uniref:PAS domain-containing protein n=1 Tax=Gnomoniopsis smithogilvyi TaxID=1191159 RepID=A0A9W8YL92_9PEZI|nr:hypothetical protein N0V93_008201 [Gnomoniopsis smithogilvyi]